MSCQKEKNRTHVGLDISVLGSFYFIEKLMLADFANCYGNSEMLNSVCCVQDGSFGA